MGENCGELPSVSGSAVEKLLTSSWLRIPSGQKSPVFMRVVTRLRILAGFLNLRLSGRKSAAGHGIVGFTFASIYAGCHAVTDSRTVF